MKRSNFLDFLKGIAMLMVIITHYEWTAAEKHMLLFPFWIDMAVPIFMVVSGYVNAISFERRGYERLSMAYGLKDILKKIIRFMGPFTIAMVPIIIYGNINEAYTIREYLLMYFAGYAIYGGYYVFMMIQFIFVFPVIYFIMKRNGRYVFNLLFCLILNILYEMLKTGVGLPKPVYRVLIFRYIFALGFGAFCYLYKEKIHNIWLLISVAVGVGYLYLVCYTGYETKVLTSWTDKAFPVIFFVGAVFIWLVQKGFVTKDVPLKILPLIGNRSYHIFLWQMVYYICFRKGVYSLIDRFSLNRPMECLLGLTINISICLVVGLLFSKIEEPVNRKLRGMI